MTLYERVKALGTENNFSIAEIERRAGLANAVIAGWNKPAAAPSVYSVKAVADVFGLTADELIRGCE